MHSVPKVYHQKGVSSHIVGFKFQGTSSCFIIELVFERFYVMKDPVFFGEPIMDYGTPI